MYSQWLLFQLDHNVLSGSSDIFLTEQHHWLLTVNANIVGKNVSQYVEDTKYFVKYL